MPKQPRTAHGRKYGYLPLSQRDRASVPPRYPKSTTTPMCCLRHRLSGPLQHQEMRAPLAVNRRKRSPGMGNPMDKTDVGRNITNVHSNSDKMAHWINAQRHDPDLKAKVFSRRAVSSLESVTLHPPQRRNWSSSSLTTSQTFPGVSSSFHHPRLIIFLVDASLRVNMDKYDLFAVTASLETCKCFKKYLAREFDYRQGCLPSGGGVTQHQDCT